MFPDAVPAIGASAKPWYRRVPADLPIGLALLVVALLGGRFLATSQQRDVRPYEGTWWEVGASPSRSLVVEPDHVARLGGVEGHWRLESIPSRFPPPPDLVVELPGGTVLRFATAADGLRSSTGSSHTHWRRGA